MPFALNAAWKQAHPQEDPPVEAAFEDLGTMLEKGSALAALDKKNLRRGLQTLLARREERGAGDLAESTGLPMNVIERMLRDSAAGGKSDMSGARAFYIARMAESASLPERDVTRWLGRSVAEADKVRSGSGITTYHIAKMAEVLGKDIFEVDVTGRAAAPARGR